MFPTLAGSGFALVRIRRRLAFSIRRRAPCGRSARLWRLAFDDRRGEIRSRGLRELLAELVAENARRHLGDVTLGKIAELKGPERHANEPRDLQPKMAQYVAHLAVLTLADRKRDPHV